MNCRGRDGRLLYPAESLAGVIYIVRNPLDVVLSAASHFQLSVQDSASMLGRRDDWETHSYDWGERLPEVRGSWSQHVISWLDEPENRVLLVRYEDRGFGDAHFPSQLALFAAPVQSDQALNLGR